jgi:hypothetical protein
VAVTTHHLTSTLRGLLLALCLSSPPIHAAPAPTAVRAEIDALLMRLQTSECKFYRNGRWFGGRKAKSHLLSKLHNAERMTTVVSTEDFIARVATKSSVSGKPYRVKCGDAEGQPSAEWLTAELGALRADQADR